MRFKCDTIIGLCDGVQDIQRPLRCAIADHLHLPVFNGLRLRAGNRKIQRVHMIMRGTQDKDPRRHPSFLPGFLCALQ